jgi:hypothetical protein
MMKNLLTYRKLNTPENEGFKSSYLLMIIHLSNHKRKYTDFFSYNDIPFIDSRLLIWRVLNKRNSLT